MQDKLKWYHVEDCILCQDNGVIQIDPWAERIPNLYDNEELDDIVCPHCNGEGQVRTWIK